MNLYKNNNKKETYNPEADHEYHMRNALNCLRDLSWSKTGIQLFELRLLLDVTLVSVHEKGMRASGIKILR